MDLLILYFKYLQIYGIIKNNMRELLFLLVKKHKYYNDINILLYDIIISINSYNTTSLRDVVKIHLMKY